MTQLVTDAESALVPRITAELPASHAPPSVSTRGGSPEPISSATFAWADLAQDWATGIRDLVAHFAILEDFSPEAAAMARRLQGVLPTLGDGAGRGSSALGGSPGERRCCQLAIGPGSAQAWERAYGVSWVAVQVQVRVVVSAALSTPCSPDPQRSTRGRACPHIAASRHRRRMCLPTRPRRRAAVCAGTRQTPAGDPRGRKAAAADPAKGHRKARAPGRWRPAPGRSQPEEPPPRSHLPPRGPGRPRVTLVTTAGRQSGRSRALATPDTGSG